MAHREITPEPRVHDITPVQLLVQASRLPDIPDIPREAGTHYSILSTNDLLIETDVVTRMKRRFGADGYIVGVGAGNIFNMLRLFPGDRLPKGIIAADVMPEVVLAGRAVVDMLQRSGTPTEFLTALGGVTRESLEEVIQDESSPVIQQKFRTSLPSTIEGLHAAKRAYDAGLKRGRPMDMVDLSSELVQSMMSRFDQMKALADQQKIAFVLQDITNPAFIAKVTSLQGYRQSRNIIYMSNVADIITRRGADDPQFVRLDAAQKALRPGRGFGRKTRNMYVFSSQRLRNPLGPYSLRLSLSPPDRTQYFGSVTRRPR